MSKFKKTEKAGVEMPVVRWALDRGIRSRKMNGMGSRSWPDRVFFLPGKNGEKKQTGPSWWNDIALKLPHFTPEDGPDGRLFFIEFKRPGEEPTPLQWDTINSLRAAGFDVEVHDNAEEAIAALQRRLAA